MWKTVIRRLLILIPQLFALALLVFFLAELLPGDALSGFMQDPDMPMERILELRAMYGLDDPWYVRFVNWLGRAMRGDWGVSMQFQSPVQDVVGPRMWNTITLSLFAMILVYGISVPLGIIAGRYNNTWKEKLISGYLYFGVAMPSIVFGFIVIYIFGFILGWFPMHGTWSVHATGTFGIFLSRLHHLVLPGISIGLFGAVGIVQYLRSEIVDAKVSDYVLTARSKGVPMNTIYNKHILRNSILPIASSFGYVIMGLMSGTVIIEQIFNFNGMGRLFFSSIGIRDFSVATFLFTFYAAAGVIGGLISDIALTVFDPRIRIK
ncbi:MAG: ABC transporter permease [Treponema sp.]|nr:ABC transporter permease [Treponema sp.]